MDTTITEKTVMPRVYQAYGDNISSKQAMEPLALAHGVGPVCGFDHLEYDENSGTVTIGSIYDGEFSKSYTSERYKLLCANHKQQTWLSDKTNSSGVVYNAFISPSGLLHIAPRIISIKVNDLIKNSWPSSNSQGIIVCLTAKFEYIDGTREYDETSITWSLTKVNTNTNVNLYTFTLEDWQSILGNIINRDTDCLIGIYMIGFSSLWVTGMMNISNNPGLMNTYLDILSKFNYILPLIPYGGKLTPFNTSNILGVPLLGDYPNKQPVICSVEFDIVEAMVMETLGGEISPEVSIHSPLTQTTSLKLNSRISVAKSGYNEGNVGRILYCRLRVEGQQSSGQDRLKSLVDEKTIMANIAANQNFLPDPSTYSRLPVIYIFNCYLDTNTSPSELVINLYIPDASPIQSIQTAKWEVKLTVSFISKQPIL